MGVVRFDGGDWYRSSSLGTALQNTSDGAWTAAVLFRQASDPASFMGYTYLCAAGPTVKAGFSRNGTGNLIPDLAGYPNAGQDIVGTTETYIAVVKKAAGAAPVTYELFSKSAGTWASPITGATNLADQTASTILEVGTWQGGSDLLDAWVGLVGWWEGAMSSGNIQTLDDNWRTSDWYNNAHGTPTCLIEFNTATPVDLIGNAASITANGSPTLDGAETLSSFNFNGTGAAATVVPYVPRRMPIGV